MTKPPKLSTPTACTAEHPCQICGANAHPCYWSNSLILCAIGGSIPHGWEQIQDAPSGQKAYVPIDLVEPELPEPATETIDDEVLEQKRQLEELISYSSERLDLYSVLHPILAKALIHKAASLPVAPEFLIQPFLPICAGIIGTAVTVRLKPDYTEPLIVWTGLIGDPGAMKTPAISAVKKPLIRLQEQAAKEYQVKLEIYEDEKRQWDALSKEDKANNPPPVEPRLRDYYMGRWTIEALLETHTEPQNLKGFVAIKDELAGLFDGMGQYKGGKGDDRQILLSLWSGDDDKKNRVTQKSFIAKTCVSITGGIQDRVLARLMGDANEDADGMWGRFNWSNPPYVRDIWVRAHCDINPLLMSLYKSLDTFEEVEFGLSPKALDLYEAFVNWLSREKELSDNALKNYLSKLRGYAARFAGLLHALDLAVEPDKEFEPAIPAETMQRSIRLCMYYLRQLRLLKATCIEDEQDLSPDLLRVVRLSQQIGWVSDRLLLRKKWGKTAEECKKTLLSLMGKGLGRTRQVGRSGIEWSFFVETVETVENAENQSGYAFDSFVETVEKKSSFFGGDFDNFLEELQPRKKWGRFQQVRQTAETLAGKGIEAVEATSTVSTNSTNSEGQWGF